MISGWECNTSYCVPVLYISSEADVAQISNDIVQVHAVAWPYVRNDDTSSLDDMATSSSSSSYPPTDSQCDVMADSIWPRTGRFGIFIDHFCSQKW